MLLTVVTNVVIALAILIASWHGGNWVRDLIQNQKNWIQRCDHSLAG